MAEGRSRGFTLIEIMLVVGLAGIIASAALAPLVFTVGSLEKAQQLFRREIREQNAVRTIFGDVRSAASNASFMPVKISRGSGDAGENACLLIWTAAPIRETGQAALVVCKVLPSPSGSALYRWIVHGSQLEGAAVMSFDTDLLKAENGNLILDGVTGVKFLVWKNGAWADKYEGPLPAALCTEITTNGRKLRCEEWFPHT